MHGGDIYRHKVNMDFSVNVNPLGMPDRVREALHKTVEDCGAYPDYLCESLLNKLSVRLNVPICHIALGNGASELISWIIRLINPRRVVLPIPSFSGYEKALLHNAGGNLSGEAALGLIYYRLKEKYDFALDEGIIELLQEDTDMLILTNPNNPTGALIEDRLLEDILEKTMERDIYLLVDECFMGFCEDREKHSLVSKLRRYNRLIIIDAFTKLYTIPGVRLGYMLCSDEKLIKKMRDSMPEWNISLFAQNAGCAILDMEDWEEYHRKTRRLVTEERGYLLRQLTSFGYHVCAGDANFLMFYSEDEQLYTRLLSYNILIRDCSDYAGLGRGWYRVAVKGHSENVKLAEALRSLRQD